MDLEGATKIPPMQTPRSRLLLSCGESILAVAQKAYRRVETMGWPVGCLARGVSHMAAPILSPLQLRCLLALSFVDRQFIVVQDVTAVLFPRAERVFRKVDELVLLMESLPVRFDGAIDGLEVFVAGVKSGVRGLVPKRCCRADVFRDIRCDEEEDALHRAVADDVRAMEKRCEDVTRKVERVEVVTDDGSGGDDDGGGTGDPRRTMEAMQSTEIVEVETQEAASRDGGSSERQSKEDDLLDLFDEAWQQKLA